MKTAGKLSDNGRKIFKELVTHTAKMGIESIDRFRLTELAFALDMQQQLREKLLSGETEMERFGIYIASTNKYQVKNAVVQLLNDYTKAVDSLSGKFGITPADREKMKHKEPPPKKPEKKSDLDKLMTVAR